LSDEQAENTPGAAAETPDVDRGRYLALVRRALMAAFSSLLLRDRLRLALYYTDQLTLAACGRVLGESEATVSRKLERTRRALRCAVERTLRENERLSDAEVEACFEYGSADGAFDLERALGHPMLGEGPASGAAGDSHASPGQVESCGPAAAVQDSPAGSFLMRGGSD
jgi:hypothetical protein